MTQEDKELLLKDLCVRLPYEVYISPVDCGKAILIGIKDGNPLLWDTIRKKEYDKPWDIEYIKPYLRPLLSMTDEEEKEFQEIKLSYHFDEDSYVLFDWLNEHHFDYRNLVKRNLALEAPEGMYNLSR